MMASPIDEGRAADLVLSGVNRGFNTADDVTYSGTIAGAMEGCALGIPSIALSQAYGFADRQDVPWACAETTARPCRKLVETGWPEDVLVNVNFPDCLPDQVKGVQVTEQGKRDLRRGARPPHRRARQSLLLDRLSARAQRTVARHRSRATDDGRISVTPLHLNLTEYAVRDRLKAVFGESGL